jgi:glycosyltransferase involved in cell wall biosynthesis
MITLSATNPCHLYDLAVALHGLGALSAYHSGYPAWKLNPPAGFPLRGHSTRTLATYGLLRLPHALRPADLTLFRWQDRGFDRAVALTLRRDGARFIHALPGQALATFRRARELGLITVLNHASGPIRRQFAAIQAERARLGLPPRVPTPAELDTFARHDAETALADFHCVASSLVSRQLIIEGVAAERIWVIPYAADPKLFYPPPPPAARLPVIVFAGQLTVRKGLPTLLEAFALVRQTHPDTELHLYGRADAELTPASRQWAALPGVKLFGPVPRPHLAEAFRRARVLALPSVEEAFGLVVPQALACGLPCVVSDQVGAGDLIVPDANGATFPTGDARSLARGLERWLRQPDNFAHHPPSWHDAARQLLAAARPRATRADAEPS